LSAGLSPFDTTKPKIAKSVTILSITINQFSFALREVKERHRGIKDLCKLPELLPQPLRVLLTLNCSPKLPNLHRQLLDDVQMLSQHAHLSRVELMDLLAKIESFLRRINLHQARTLILRRISQINWLKVP
jgi:hypothetical protein